MENFEFALLESDGTVALKTAIHTDVLTGREGYKADFLHTHLPLPVLSAELRSQVAIVQHNVGPNGNKVLDYTHFSVVFNKDQQLPFYTAVNMVGKTNLLGLVHEERGSDSWHKDKRIAVGDDSFQYGNKEYTGSHLAKGHMVRYYDPAWGTAEEQKIAIGDTFHYTNACPQIAYFNGVVWNYLEDYCAAT